MKRKNVTNLVSYKINEFSSTLWALSVYKIYEKKFHESEMTILPVFELLLRLRSQLGAKQFVSFLKEIELFSWSQCKYFKETESQKTSLVSVSLDTHSSRLYSANQKLIILGLYAMN